MIDIVRVLREPTEAMIAAGERAAWDGDNSMPAFSAMRKAWSAMLAASPQGEGGPPTRGGVVGDLDLYDDKVQAGISWTMRQWGEALGLTTWTQGDGSESVEGDVGAEIHTILIDAGLRDPETNEMVRVKALAQKIDILRRADAVVAGSVLVDDADFDIEKARRGAASWREIATNVVAAYDARVTEGVNP